MLCMAAFTRKQRGSDDHTYGKIMELPSTKVRSKVSLITEAVIHDKYYVG